MSLGEESDFGPGYLEELSDYSNQDLRLGPEYAEIEEDFRKIKSFKDAVDLLESSEGSYHRKAKAVGSAWPEAYEAFISIDEVLGELTEKRNAERVMNSAFHNFEAQQGEVSTRAKELVGAVREARSIYEEAADSLVMEIRAAAFQGQKTPLEYAEGVSESEAFDEMAEDLEGYILRPEDSLGELAWKFFDETDCS